MTHHRQLQELLDSIDEPNRTACKRIWQENEELFRTAKGSKANHQTWEGGYLDHISETCTIATTTYCALEQIRPLPFRLQDALLALFLHDIEKPWRYGQSAHPRPDLNSDERIHEFRQQVIEQYGFLLTPEIWNAVRYAHGEGDEYSPDRRVRTPLAAFVGSCDVISARVWYDEPHGSRMSGS